MLPVESTTDHCLEAFLLGEVPFSPLLALVQRLVYETSGRIDRRSTLLVCEHPPVVTVGRQGSRGHIRLSSEQLRRRQLDVRWVNRGGGVLLHTPGQLAVYPIVPLERLQLSVGQYLDRFHEAVESALAEMGVATHRLPGRSGLWGRAGQLVYMGVAVKNGVSYFGCYINVCPSLGLLRAVDSDPTTATAASSLAAERRQVVRMSGVRERLVRHLAAALDAPRYHIYSQHPLLARTTRSTRNSAARAG